MPADAGHPAGGLPVCPSNRIVTLDFIRGVAVLGILFANVVAYSQIHLAYSWPGALPRPMDGADTVVWLVQYLLIDGKMRGLFTLLFGAGMALFMDRAWARGETSWLQLRRLLWLGAFGLAHFLFLFWGDILFLYAQAGIAVLPFLKLPASRLLGIGLAWYAVGAFLFAQPYLGVVLLEQSPAAQQSSPENYRALKADWVQTLRKAETERMAFASGRYADEIAYVATERAPQLWQIPWFALFETIPLMLIGMALYRFGLFAGAFDSAALKRWGWAGVGLGTVLTLPFALWAWGKGFPPFLSQFVMDDAVQVPRLPVTVGYIALLAAYAPVLAQGWLGTRLVAAGRMAFSNYVGTSLIMMLLFRQWAGGLFGELGRVELLLPLLAGWALMLVWSKPWLERFHYGPLEWLWRCLTYWKIFPLSR